MKKGDYGNVFTTQIRDKEGQPYYRSDKTVKLRSSINGRTATKKP